MSIDILFDLLGLLFDGAGSAIGTAIESHRNAAALSKARANRLEQMRQQIASCPLVAAASAPDGRAAFQGRARPLDVMLAPLSRRPVIGYRLRLDGLFQEENKKVTRSLADVSVIGEFELVENDTKHVVEVTPQRCVPLLTPEPSVHVELAAFIEPPLADIVDRACVSASDLATALQLRAVEHLLEPGEPVFAFGMARREVVPGSAGAGYRDAPFRTTLSSPPDGLLIVADQHRDALLASLHSFWELLPPA